VSDEPVERVDTAPRTEPALRTRRGARPGSGGERPRSFRRTPASKPPSHAASGSEAPTAKTWLGVPRAIWPCIAYLIVEFARPMEWVSALALIRPGMLVAAWGAAAVVLTLRKDRRPLPRPVKLMFLFLLLMVWQVPWAMNNRWALWGLGDFALLVLGGVVPIAMLARDLAAVRTLLTAYVVLHVPMALHGLTHKGYGQGGWLFDNNDLALALNAGLGVAVFLFLETRSLMRRLWLAAVMGLLVAGVISTTSRGGFVGLALLALFVLIVSPGKRKLIVAVCLAGGTIGVLALAPPQFWARMHSIETASQEGDTGFQRLYLWGIAWREFLHHPITGVGTRNFGIQAPIYENREYADATGTYMWGRVAHSIYFTLLSEQGLVGAVIFAMTCFWTIRTGLRIRRRARDGPPDPATDTAANCATGLLAGVFGVLVTGTFLSVLYYPVLWVLVGMMAALDRVTAPPAAVPVRTSRGHRAASPRESRTPRIVPGAPGGALR
jgi:O-antigen ligase